ncbi:MAG: AAA family ATPase [Candidatus Binatia bacterium]
MDLPKEILPVRKVNELDIQLPEKSWLIHSMWTYAAVGIIGGPPKCCKSWLGLDMAVSVASGSPCLGLFPVQRPGPALIFLAEDATSAVRTRIEALCAHRQLDIDHLDLYVITASSLRLDLIGDRQRLQATLAAFKPRLLLLDPLVRLHRLDENSAADISSLLGFVREMQRSYDTAIVLVHHTSKKHYAQPGQALRGSSDLHAFGDSNAYLARHKDRVILTLEHRAAKPPDPIELKLVSLPEGSATHLEISSPAKIETNSSLAEGILALLLQAGRPLPRTTIRKHLKVNNQRLGQTLVSLDRQGLILKTASGWVYTSTHHHHSLQAQRNTEKFEKRIPQQCSLLL